MGLKKAFVVVILLAGIVLAQQSAYGQCGGSGWSGLTTCVSGYVCTFSNNWYSQCLPGTAPPSPSAKPTTLSTPTTLVTSALGSSCAPPVTVTVTVTVGEPSTAPVSKTTTKSGVGPVTSSTTWTPSGNQTYIIIGQNYLNEWQNFASTVKTPTGISIYGDIYSGALNSDSQNLLSNYAASHNGFVEVGMSWKDDMTQQGYTIYQGAKLCHDIASGKYDQSIGALAAYLGMFPNVKYLLRVDYEVSGNLHANTNPNEFDSSTFDLTAYPEAFAHVRKLFLGVISNVEFVFHPVRGSAQLLYPGDNVVDWQGFSIFNNDVCLTVGSTSNCQGGQLDPNILLDIEFARKPKIIAESAVQPPSSSSSSLFIDYLSRVKSMIETYDFAAWTYINSNWPAHGWDTADWGDSRIETNLPVLQWYEANVVSNSRYIYA